MAIYDVSDRFVQTLQKVGKKEVCFQEFNKISSIHAKVNYVENLLIKYDEIPGFELIQHQKDSKSDDKSLKFRNEGNEFYQNKNYYRAVELYNKSISFAEEGSENLSLGYGNRSAVLFVWKFYKQSLDDIKLAREANFEEKIKFKFLDKRERQCLKLLGNQRVEVNPFNFELAYGVHPKIPFISSCLDIKVSKVADRSIVTKEELKSGDMVMAEDPFCTVLLPSQRYRRCANCTQEKYLSLIPCPNCTSAMFCSNKCLEEGTEIFHKYECPIIDVLFRLFNQAHLMALRVTLVAISQFESIDEMQHFCKDPSNQNRSAFDLDYENFSKKEYYRAIHGLETHRDKRSTEFLFERAVITAVLKRFITSRTPLKDVLKNDNHVNFFTELLFQHLQTVATSMANICLIENHCVDDFTFGCGAYGVQSLLNHSCAPNTVRCYLGTKVLIFAVRPIPVGGELYDNYGHHFLDDGTLTRMMKLAQQYHFVCQCEACEFDYPEYSSLRVHPAVPSVIGPEDLKAMQLHDREFAEKNLQKYTSNIDAYYAAYPCRQLVQLEEHLKMALNILIDAIPLKTKVMKKKLK